MNTIHKALSVYRAGNTTVTYIDVIIDEDSHMIQIKALSPAVIVPYQDEITWFKNGVAERAVRQQFLVCST
jgi:hypothetical protein